MKKDLLLKLLLIAIIVLGFGLRFYKLGEVPLSISWDEAAVGYNAFTIASYGRDEYGKFFPSFFKSFGDDKHPVHVYLTALSVKLFGLSEFSVRFSASLFGILNVLLIFLLADILFKSKTLGLITAFFLAISPYNIHFSRFNHEANFALFFFMLSIFLFYKSFEKKYFLSLSIISFGITFITYHPAKIVVPVILTTLLILYRKTLKIQRSEVFPLSTIIIIFAVVLFLNPEFLGIARINQTSQGNREIEKTYLFQKTNNHFLGRINLAATQYSWHFLPDYLFINGDRNPRLSSNAGQLYKLDSLFLMIGMFFFAV